MKPLKDITVIDLSKVLAGPYCAQQLGDLGANVIKVEPVNVGDDTRSWQPQKDGQSSIFLAVNRNKRSLALDLKSDEGRAIVHSLVAEADVVIQGFKGGTASKLGVDYATLSALNKNLIYCEISGYGQEGPLGGQPGYDVMLQAFSGMMSTMGEPSGPLARASFSPVDMGTGMLGFSGVLAALLERSLSGRGAHIELTLLDTAMSFMGYLSQNYWLTGKVPGPMGTAHGSLAPYQSFRATDGSLMIGAGTDAQWQQLCSVLDLSDYARNPRFCNSMARADNREEIATLLQGAIGKKSLAHWLDVLTTGGIPCAPIHTLDQALTHPQVEARGIVVHPEHPVLGSMAQIGMPLVFNGEPRETPRAAPLLGAHSVEILGEMGFSSDSISDMISRGIIGTGPGGISGNER